jgi:uncharacterized protein YcnI
MRKLMLTTALTLFTATGAAAHTYFVENYAPAGYKQDMTMRVPHGCKDKAVKEVHVQMPPNVTGVTVFHNRDWKVETKMRKLDKPVPGEGGNMITETVDEIIWKDPTSPLPAMGFFDSFQFRVSLPKEEGSVLWFKSYNVCVDGSDDRYVDVPKEAMNTSQPDFAKKIGEFMRSVKGPAPYLVLTKPTRPQYPWENMDLKAKAEAPAEQKSAAK